jgi:hypothetical protein
VNQEVPSEPKEQKVEENPILPPKTSSQDDSVIKVKDKHIIPEEESGPPEIDPQEVEYNEVRDFLGQGSFGRVYQG